jgi:nucleotide-binding universal stress UspA family protein
LVAIPWETGVGATRQATLGRARAEEALERAMVIAAEEGVQAETRIVEARDPAETLVAEAEGSDLLALGSSGGGRLAGNALGRPGTTALHPSRTDVLIVRRPPGENVFPSRIVLADDGTAASERAALVAAAIAGAHQAHVAVAAPMAIDHEQHARLLEHGKAIMAAGAPEPQLTDVHRDAHETIPRLARGLGATLVVVGSRGLQGPRALASVSERVAHEAPCSVLVVRADEG